MNCLVLKYCLHPLDRKNSLNTGLVLQSSRKIFEQVKGKSSEETFARINAVFENKSFQHLQKKLALVTKSLWSLNVSVFDCVKKIITHK